MMGTLATTLIVAWGILSGAVVANHTNGEYWSVFNKVLFGGAKKQDDKQG